MTTPYDPMGVWLLLTRNELGQIELSYVEIDTSGSTHLKDKFFVGRESDLDAITLIVRRKLTGDLRRALRHLER